MSKGFSPKYGARPIKREIQTRIENPLSEMLLRGEIKEGAKITIGLQANEIHIQLVEE